MSKETSNGSIQRITSVHPINIACSTKVPHPRNEQVERQVSGVGTRAHCRWEGDQ